MSFPPNNNNINDDPHSELELLEGLLNNMFSGATSMIFQTLQEPFLNDVEQPQQHGSYSSIMEDLDGSDFRRIAEKKRQQRQQQEGGLDSIDKQNNSTARQNDSSSSLTPVNHRSPHENIRSISNNDSVIGNGLGGIVAALLGDFDPSTHPAGHHDSDNNQGWAFTSSSTSQRRTVRVDGTEETVITTKRNGTTETVTTIKHPDGTIEETRNIGERPSILSLISSSVSSAPSLPAFSNSDDNSSTSSSANNPLKSLFRSIWG